MADDDSRALIPVKDIGDGDLIECQVKGDHLLVGRADGRYFAIKNLCTHAWVSFGYGSLNGRTITCPWHGLSFDVHSGECETWPGLQRLFRHRVTVQDGMLCVGAEIADD